MKDFKLYRNQVLFIGLELKEKMAIESSVTRYSIFYKDKISEVINLDTFDIICLPEIEFLQNKDLLSQLQKPIILIGEKVLEGTKGVLRRPIFVKQCLDVLQKLLPEVKKPVLPKVEIGSIVKSKTTPMFGKGIVTSVISETDVMVKFPKSNLLTKNDSIRCHISQLQIVGNIETYIEKIN